MPYIVPSVLVYQQLENAGGVPNSTPDLDAVVIGPMYNIVRTDSSDGDSLAASAVESISGDVDGAVALVPGSTITDWQAESLALTALAETGFRLSMPNTQPGQDVIDSEVSAHMSNATVKVNSFSCLLPISSVIDKNLVGVVGATDFTVGPAYAMADTLLDGSGTYLEVGDIVEYSYGDTGTETVGDATVVIGIEDDGTTVRLAHPLPITATAEYASATVYRNVSFLTIDAGVVTTDASSLSQIQLDFTDSAIGFPLEVTGTDFPIKSGTVHVSYRALRTDKTSTVLTIDGPDSLTANVGETTSSNPLGLGVQLALANTTTVVKAVSVESDDLAGYLQALELIEEEQVAYAIVPMTQNMGIISTVNTHVKQMSTPQNAAWRVSLVNTEIPEFLFIGTANDSAPATCIAHPDQTAAAERLYLEAAGIDFISDGVTPGDSLVVTAQDGAGSIPVSTGYTILNVVGVDRIEIDAPAAVINAITDGDASQFYIRRDLTKAQQAEQVALTSESFGNSRIWHIQPDTVGVDVNGVTEYLPGYYLACGMAGMVAGFPVQQGFTNIAVAGITDLRNSNFYFNKTDLGTMAEKGTCLFTQATQGGVPYCRHELTTDVSTLQYSEMVKVKNLDFLSYFYKDKLKPFIGSWNITEDTLNNMRQVILAASEQLVIKKLPRIGPPLLSYDLQSLEQDDNQVDTVNIRLGVETVTPNNYTNLFLII